MNKTISNNIAKLIIFKQGESPNREYALKHIDKAKLCRYQLYRISDEMRCDIWVKYNEREVVRVPIKIRIFNLLTHIIGDNISKPTGIMSQLDEANLYHYSKLTLKDIEEALLELEQSELLPQFYKISDNLYCYRYKNTSYIGTLEFFEQVDEEVRKNIKKYGRLQ